MNIRDCLTEISEIFSKLLGDVQNKEHVELIKQKIKQKFMESPIYIKKYIHLQEYNYARPEQQEKEKCDNNSNKTVTYSFVVGVYTNIFLTIYDSCNGFVVDYNESILKGIYNDIGDRLVEPMRTVFFGRYLHHMTLILDGIVKNRCLFKDYDPTFEPKQEDYEETRVITQYIVDSWNESFEKTPGLIAETEDNSGISSGNEGFASGNEDFASGNEGFGLTNDQLNEK